MALDSEQTQARSEEPTRLLIVDDQTLYREGLCELFSHWPEFDVIGDVSNGYDAIEFCRRRKPSLVLMDVHMPGMDGVEATRLLLEEHRDMMIVILTVTLDDECLFGAIRYGACGYILKEMPARQLRNRLHGVIRGEGVLSGPAAKKVIEKLNNLGEETISDNDAADTISCLSDREKAIIKLVSRGLSNEQIGSELFISNATVKKQLSTILQKLYLENRVQLAVLATRNGLGD